MTPSHDYQIDLPKSNSEAVNSLLQYKVRVLLTELCLLPKVFPRPLIHILLLTTVAMSLQTRKAAKTKAAAPSTTPFPTLIALAALCFVEVDVDDVDVPVAVLLVVLVPVLLASACRQTGSAKEVTLLLSECMRKIGQTRVAESVRDGEEP